VIDANLIIGVCTFIGVVAVGILIIWAVFQ
jgi:hypothetical protein